MRMLFDKIAWRYDFVNEVLSFGSTLRWRRAAAREVVWDNPRWVLDVCSGTATQSLAICRNKDFGGRVVCADISWEMLRRGRDKLRARLSRHNATGFVCGAPPGRQEAGFSVLADVHHLALKAEMFDCATACFGVRNFEDMPGGLKEIARVLKPAGKIVILEFSRPSHPLVWRAYRWYLKNVLPAIGGFLTRQAGAYRYLASSIDGFLTPRQLAERLEEAGFTQVRHRPLQAGIVAITTAVKI